MSGASSSGGDLVQLRRRGDPPPQGGAPSSTYGHTATPRRRAHLPRCVITFGSGKGGVGKSTMAVSTASAMAQRGLAVGILDADVFGPSVPRMLGLAGEQLRWSDDNRILPSENFGIKIISSGLATPEADTPLVWRASVATSAIVQLLDDVDWGPLDVLIVDLPPGTGDIQLTIAQELPITAAVVVTTPQVVATDDVRRSLRMLLESRVHVAGVVENMSGFVAPDTGALYHPFGRGGGAELARAYGVPLLAEVPLLPGVRLAADEGRPALVSDNEAERAPLVALCDRLLADERIHHALASGERTTLAAGERECRE